MQQLGMVYRNYAKTVQEPNSEVYFGKLHCSHSTYEHLIAATADTAFQFFSAIKKPQDVDFSQQAVCGAIKDFMVLMQTYDKLPFTQKKGTTSNGSLLWVYLFNRLFSPDIYAESGVFVGSSLFIARHGAPNAEIHGYDPNLNNLAFKDETIHLHSCDWSLDPIAAKSDRDLCYFDDHIDCAMRIIEAQGMGFKNLIFDDCVDVGQFYKYRYIGLPTVPLIVDPKLDDGESVEWYHAGSKKYLRYTFDRQQTRGAENLIAFAVQIPDLEPICGLTTNDQWFVQLK